MTNTLNKIMHNGDEYLFPSGSNYNAGNGITIGTIQTNTMRGPCPEGFHIPTQSDRAHVITAMNTLGLTNNSSFMNYLKLPNAGYRRISDTKVTSQIYQGYYWTCEYDSQGAAKRFSMTQSAISVANTQSISDGLSIRPYKDESVTPDNTWTTLYDGSSVATGAGIFHNSSAGIISLSSNGTNWYTIADKNLGATSVYGGGVETSAECGKYYQRGNNHGFDGISTTTLSNTSATQVDASGYGAGNYYSSDTFITTAPWDSSSNNDLRGGVTGIVTTQDAISNAGVVISSDSDNVLTTGAGLRAGDESDLPANPSSNCLYFVF